MHMLLVVYEIVLKKLQVDPGKKEIGIMVIPCQVER